MMGKKSIIDAAVKAYNMGQKVFEFSGGPN